MSYASLLLSPTSDELDVPTRIDPAPGESQSPKQPNRYLFIGKSIKAIREEKGLSQSAVATLSGLSQNQMSNYENGVNVPSPENLFRLCGALDVDPLVFALKCLEQTELIDARNALTVSEYEDIAQDAVQRIKEKRKRIHQQDETALD